MITSHRCCSQQVPIEAEKNFVEPVDRRHFLWNWGGGLGGIALAHLLGRSGLLADTPKLLAAMRAELERIQGELDQPGMPPLT